MMSAVDGGLKNDSMRNFMVLLLTPLVRILLRFGYSASEIGQVVKKVAVDNALTHEEFFGRKKPFVSHASVVTGLSRKEVKRLWDADDMEEVMGTQLLNRAQRILSGWACDPRYGEPDDPATPREILPYSDASGASFYQLVREYAGDIPPRSALDTLCRYGTVERIAPNKIKLLERNFIAEAGSDERINSLSFISGEFMTNVERNLRHDQNESWLNRFWFERWMPEDKVADARAMIRKEMMECGNRIEEQLARMAHKKPRADVQYLRVGAGSYYVETESPLQ